MLILLPWGFLMVGRMNLCGSADGGLSDVLNIDYMRGLCKKAAGRKITLCSLLVDIEIIEKIIIRLYEAFACLLK